MMHHLCLTLDVYSEMAECTRQFPLYPSLAVMMSVRSMSIKIDVIRTQ